ncbi:hypothetical protein [Coleofasciculus sp. E1-EBD-02]|uniref:hypothetical protein n=1 Tax=Coleofasciculus sp. E1-EBD-02 TaxID=3068481 RepID=UPI0032FE3B09
MSGKSPIIKTSPHLPLTPSPPQPITVIMGIQPDMILGGRAIALPNRLERFVL